MGGISLAPKCFSYVTQVTSFLGMSAYYLCFLPQYSATTAPLCHLLKKEKPWVWTPECSDAVCLLKKQLSSLPIPAHFNQASATIVTCDASAVAVGAVLSQIQNGVERPLILQSSAIQWSIPGPAAAHTPDLDSDRTEHELVQLLHSPLHLQELQNASASDPVLHQLVTYIRGGWPATVPEAHEGHMGIVCVKQRCGVDLVWWPGIDRDIESLIRDCDACLIRGKTGPPATPPTSTTGLAIAPLGTLAARLLRRTPWGTPPSEVSGGDLRPPL